MHHNINDEGMFTSVDLNICLSMAYFPLHLVIAVNERNNLCLLNCVSRPSRSIVRENTLPKETRRWHIIREGRKEVVDSKIEKCSKSRFVMQTGSWNTSLFFRLPRALL